MRLATKAAAAENRSQTFGGELGSLALDIRCSASAGLPVRPRVDYRRRSVSRNR